MGRDVNLFDYAERLAEVVNSLYRGIRNDRVRLLEFMDTNGWFGFEPVVHDKVPYISHEEAAIINDLLTLWLSAYLKPNDAKLDALLLYFEPTYPETCRLYREFSSATEIREKAHTWKLLDCIFANIEKEITACNEDEVEAFIKLLDADSSLASAGVFADFIRYVELSEWDYRFGSRGKPESENGAYPLQDFAVMAYCVFNDDMWRKQGLVEKAVASPRYADLWLHTAMQFVCALRNSDLSRLPAPQLPYEPERVLSDIANGVFSDSSSAALTDELIFRMEIKGAKPSKTKAYRDVPKIKLFIPESLRVPLGTIIAIAIAHHPDVKPGGQFIFPGDYRRMHKQFFGAEFSTAMSKRHLSVRRCNKSYLQGIDVAASLRDEPGKPKGYILAALARSHKGGIGTIPEITEVYLKDANFTGYSPEFIAREMFERGVFSFIACALLEIYTGEEFKLLPVRSQTLLIGEVGLRPNQIDEMLAVAETGLRNARDTVAAIIYSSGMGMQGVGSALQNIASGNAPARTLECLCLITAVGRPCPYPSRAGCIGCGYEILTKTALHLLAREFARLKQMRENSTESERWRYTAILSNAVVPAIDEIISCAKAPSTDTDMQALLEIVERGT